MKPLIVVALMSVLWSQTECQHFCDSYLFSGHEVIVHRVLSQDFGLIIIGDKYWKLKRNSDNTISLKVEKPLGFSDRLKDYSFWFHWYSSLVQSRVSGFYNPTTKTVDEITFSESGVLQVVEENIKLDPINGLENVTFTLLPNQAISRRFNSGNQSFEYKAVDYSVRRKTGMGFIKVKYYSEFTQRFLEDYKYYFNNGYHLVGEYYIHIFFSNNASIVYCYYDNCEKGEQEKQVLVDCQQWLDQKTTTTSTSTTTSSTTSTTPTTRSSSTSISDTTEVSKTTSEMSTATEEQNTTTVVSGETGYESTTALTTNPTTIKISTKGQNATEEPIITSMMTSKTTTKRKKIWENPYVKITLICLGVFVIVVIILIVGIIIFFWPQIRRRTNSEDTEASEFESVDARRQIAEVSGLNADERREREEEEEDKRRRLRLANSRSKSNDELSSGQPKVPKRRTKSFHI